MARIKETGRCGMNLGCFFKGCCCEFIRYAEIFKILKCKRCGKEYAQLGDSGYLRLSLKESRKIAREMGKPNLFD